MRQHSSEVDYAGCRVDSRRLHDCDLVLAKRLAHDIKATRKRSVTERTLGFPRSARNCQDRSLHVTPACYQCIVVLSSILIKEAHGPLTSASSARSGARLCVAYKTIKPGFPFRDLASLVTRLLTMLAMPTQASAFGSFCCPRVPHAEINAYGAQRRLGSTQTPGECSRGASPISAADQSVLTLQLVDGMQEVGGRSGPLIAIGHHVAHGGRH
jgi:hypothetical protein